MIRLTITAFLVVACLQFASSQCVDSNMVKPFYQGCNGYDYRPVCACGITYFNECYAVNQYGVRYGTYADGVCNAFDFSIFPTQFTSGTSAKVNFFIQFRKSQNNTAYVYVVDLFGAPVYRRIIQTPFNSEKFMIEESAYFRTGMYFFIVQAENEAIVKKLVVIKAE